MSPAVLTDQRDAEEKRYCGNCAHAEGGPALPREQVSVPPEDLASSTPRPRARNR